MRKSLLLFIAPGALVALATLLLIFGATVVQPAIAEAKKKAKTARIVALGASCQITRPIGKEPWAASGQLAGLLQAVLDEVLTPDCLAGSDCPRSVLLFALDPEHPHAKKVEKVQVAARALWYTFETAGREARKQMVVDVAGYMKGCGLGELVVETADRMSDALDDYEQLAEQVDLSICRATCVPSEVDGAWGGTYYGGVDDGCFQDCQAVDEIEDGLVQFVARRVHGKARMSTDELRALADVARDIAE